MERGFIKKTCSFYVSEYHLVTMLLPYIKQKIDEETAIKTMLEENIEENMAKLVTNINLETKYKNEILNMNWKSFQIYKYPKIEEELKIDKPTNIIISGKFEYVEMMNKNIEKWIERNDIKSTITINNCYEVTGLGQDINQILSRHDKILNTSGEQDIQTIFEGYDKNKIVNS